MVVVRIVVFLLGAAVAVAVLMSAIRTVVLPRAQRVKLSRAVFLTVRSVFELRLKLAKTYEDRDRALALYAPLCLVMLPAVWMAITIVAPYAPWSSDRSVRLEVGRFRRIRPLRAN